MSTSEKPYQHRQVPPTHPHARPQPPACRRHAIRWRPSSTQSAFCCQSRALQPDYLPWGNVNLEGGGVGWSGWKQHVSSCGGWVGGIAIA